MQHDVKQHQKNWHPYQRVSQSICQMIYEGTVTSPEEENSHTVKKVNLVHSVFDFQGAILHFYYKTTKLSTFYCQGTKIKTSVQFLNWPIKNRSLMKLIVFINELDRFH
jgi:hypothetical protein